MKAAALDAQIKLIRRQYPEHILFFRVTHGYRAFDGDARKLWHMVGRFKEADTFDVLLKDAPLLMNKLEALGQKIAICEASTSQAGDTP